MKVNVKLLTGFLFFFSCLIQNGYSQTTLFTETFEANDEGTDWRANDFDDGANDLFTRFNITNDPDGPNSNLAHNYTGHIGNFGFGGEDMDSPDNPLGSGEDAYMVFKTLDITSYRGGKVTVKLHMAQSGTANRYGSTDFMKVEYAFDSNIATGANSVNGLPSEANVKTGTYTIFGAYYGGYNTNSTPDTDMHEDTDLDGDADVNDGGSFMSKVTLAADSFTFNVPSNATNMSIRLHLQFNGGSNEFVYDQVVISAEQGLTTWNGTTWSGGVPTSTDDAAIASNTTPGAFTCKDLTINSGFDLTLSNGVTATIHGDLTNNGNGTSGTGTLNFTKSGTTTLGGTAFTHAGVIEVETGTTLATASKLTLSNGASLMHGTSTPGGGGSVTGTVTLEKSIGSTTDGWRSFSLPVNDLIDNLETGLNTRCSNSSPSDRRNVYHWDGTDAGSNTATGWTEANHTTDDENKGYSIYLSNNSSSFFNFSTTVSISGTPNDGTKTFNLDYTYDPNSTKTLTSERGWNLIPNYFPSNLSIHNLINDADFDPTYKAVHIWDQGAGQMKAMNQSTLVNYNTPGGSIFSTLRQVPPFMSFWVKANANSQSVQLKNSMRTGRSDSLPANTYFKHSHDVFRIEIKDQDNYQDQFSVAFIDGATDNFDNRYDIYKFKSFSTEVPTLYTKDNNSELISLTALPIRESYSVPVYLESEKDKNSYTIKALTQEYSNYYNVELVDNKTGTKTNLLEEDYTLNFDKNYIAARLTLNFNKKSTTSIDEIYSQEKSYAYTNNNGINIVYQNNNRAALSNITIYNTLGQKLYQQKNIQANSTINYVPANTNMQVYIIKVESIGNTKTLRVVY